MNSNILHSIVQRIANHDFFSGIVLLGVGLVFAFFGQVILKPLVTFAGSVGGFFLGQKILIYLDGQLFDLGKHRQLILIAAALVFGIVVGAVCWKLLRLGIGVLGGIAGFLVASMIVGSNSTLFHSKWKEVFIFSLVAIGAFVSLISSKVILRGITAVVGSSLLILGLDVFVRSGLLEKALASLSAPEEPITISSGKEMYMLGGTVVVAGIAFLTQQCMSKKQRFL
jgi:hypothetical protein